jgi:hypothetical protein
MPPISFCRFRKLPLLAPKPRPNPDFCSRHMSWLRSLRRHRRSAVKNRLESANAVVIPDGHWALVLLKDAVERLYPPGSYRMIPGRHRVEIRFMPADFQPPRPVAFPAKAFHLQGCLDRSLHYVDGELVAIMVGPAAGGEEQKCSVIQDSTQTPVLIPTQKESGLKPLLAASWKALLDAIGGGMRGRLPARFNPEGFPATWRKPGGRDRTEWPSAGHPR